jgi:CRISPR-associated protein Csm3
MSDERTVNLYGRLFIKSDILALTGLHIGGAQTALSIGGVDNPIIRDALTAKPYIPGSSLRGKMRSLWEKTTGAAQNRSIGRDVKIHICREAGDYKTCSVCQIYGVPGEMSFSSPTRLIVRDAFLSDQSADELKEARTDLPYAEVKWEAAIDRVTSAATPRQIERVPAGTIFTGFEMVFSVYEGGDLNRFTHVIEAMQLLEDDYLGGAGSRGGGKIQFQNLRLTARSTRASEGYGKEHSWQGEGKTVSELLQQKESIQDWAKGVIPREAYQSQ